MRKFLADTFALVVFSTLAGMFAELLVAGMTLLQSAQARLTAIPMMLITARPYGVFRDWVFRMSGAGTGGEVRRAMADIGAFVTFQVPVYATILFLGRGSGRSWRPAAAQSSSWPSRGGPMVSFWSSRADCSA
jgi:L-alanine exporter